MPGDRFGSPGFFSHSFVEKVWQVFLSGNKNIGRFYQESSLLYENSCATIGIIAAL
jgi:hypothetical protein